MNRIGSTLVALVAGVVGCTSSDPNWYEYRWAFNCEDGSFFICRDEGYFHCDDGPTTYEPGPNCALVSATCTSNPKPGQSEAQAACGVSCAGTVTCDSAAPVCPSGEVPLVAGGCYSGACALVSRCDAPPLCAVINDEADCLARPDCSTFYKGLDCTNPDGAACHSGDTDCTCANFEFASCQGQT